MKKSIRNSLLASLGILISISTISCGNPALPLMWPVYTPEWDEFDGWSRFRTSDSEVYDYSFWKYETTTDGLYPIEIDLYKNSGAPGWGYGIIFARQPDGRCYQFLISTYGWTRLDYYDPINKYTEIKEWTYEDIIIEGIGAINTIQVDWESGSNRYSLSINDKLVDYFYLNEVSLDKRLTEGMAGFLVTVGDEEDESFPYIPVEVLFKMIEPISSP